MAFVHCQVCAQTLQVVMKGDGFAFVVLADQPLRTAMGLQCCSKVRLELCLLEAQESN